MRARDAGQDFTNDRACRFPFILQVLQTRNDREYEPEPEPVPSGQSQSQRRLHSRKTGQPLREPEPEPAPSGQSQSQRRLISHSVGVDRRFLFYIRGDSRTAKRRVSHAGRPGVFLFCHGLQKQTMESFAGPRAPRAAAVSGSAALRQTRACNRCPPCLPGRRLPRLALLPLEPDRGKPGSTQQLPRSCDRKADRARPRVAAKSIPPSKRAAAVLRDAPEWGPLSDGGKTAGGGNARPPGAHTREKLESRGAGANDAGAQRHAASEALPGADSPAALGTTAGARSHPILLF